MTITWRILELDRTLTDGGVFQIHWDLTAVSDTVPDNGPDVTPLSAREFGMIRVTADPESPTFIPYEDLTENDCLGWLWAGLNKQQAEQRVAAELEALENPITGDGVPWA